MEEQFLKLAEENEIWAIRYVFLFVYLMIVGMDKKYHRLDEKGIKFNEKRFDDKLTRARAIAAVGRVTD
jgi:hypothetical protein